MGKLSADSWLGLVKASAGGKKKKKSGAELNRKASPAETATIGVLTFEVASLMCRAASLWHSLTHDRLTRLRDEVFQQEGVRKLVSDDGDFLASLALAEFIDSLGSLARAVARLAMKCADPVLHRFDRVFAHLIDSGADIYGLEYAGGKMDRKVRKMERLAAASSNLYQELEVLAELEQTLRRMQVQAAARAGSGSNRRRCLSEFKHKVAWQRQEVKSLRDSSPWNRTFDYTVRLLARSLFTMIARIRQVFEFRSGVESEDKSRDLTSMISRCHSVAGLTSPFARMSHSESVRFPSLQLSAAEDTALPPASKHSNWKKTKWLAPSRSFGSCVAAGADSPVLRNGFKLRTSLISAEDDDNEEVYFRGCSGFGGTNPWLSLLDSRHKTLKPLPFTLGDAALAFHYANVIIVIEKLSMSPHLIGADARDDLYNMLPSSITAALRVRLKPYAKSLPSSFHDPVLAAEWREAVCRILDWLAPLAHNMIRWQSERNVEQQHLVSSASVLLLQTLYFANQEKTETAIVELLVGLNYLWRFSREVNGKAKVECVSSRDFDECFESLDLKI